jgi:hypothetical protein
MEVARTGERLPDQARSNDLVLSHDQTPSSFVFEKDNGQTGDRVGINDPGEKCEYNGHGD